MKNLLRLNLLLTLTWIAPSFALSAEKTGSAPLTAKWIWRDGADVHGYNQTVIALKKFEASSVQRAVMRVTADSYYRLSLNGRWVNDGPARTWPNHMQYDELDVTPYLQEGGNEIQIVARYFGVGDFHRVPQQAGLLAQLDIVPKQGDAQTIVTDSTWEIAEAKGWLRNTPKVSVQMEPAEWFDAGLADAPAFTSAKELFAAGQGPWGELACRDVALLTRQSVALRSFLGANIVKAEGRDFCLPAARLVHPGLIEANQHASCGCGMVTTFVTGGPATVRLQSEGFQVTVDGQQAKDGRYSVGAGKHIALALVSGLFSHAKEKSLRWLEPTDVRLENPMDAKAENPWCFLRFPESAIARTDILWIGFTNEDKDLAKATAEYRRLSDKLFSGVKTVDDFQKLLADRAELMPSDQMFVKDSHWQFVNRQVVGDASALVSDPAALMHESPSVTVVKPSAEGDVELSYDLGQQDVGYYDFDLVADAGVVVDVFGLEYIAPDGRLQHTGDNRNGMRFVTRAGSNRFTSLKRRSGRFIFITLRNQKSPAVLRNFHLVESTYPVNYVGRFSSSDPRLDRIWEISTRTLKLCMEDTFTDCPLYEQTHWVGDARNESLLAYPVFGSTDLARRCIRVTAQSLERYPMAGCQTPSCWDVLIPNWSFLWGISVWDYYWYTGDAEAIREFWPAVIQNLKGAEGYVNEQGLFSAPFWNFFDWTRIDQNQKVVLHNTLFFIGAIDAAVKIGDVLQDDQHDAWLKSLRARLVSGANRLWDEKKMSYPDSVRDDGTISPSTCQHTSFLAVLFDVIDPKNVEAARRNILNPPEGMVQVGSPFASLYLLDAMDKLGQQEEVVQEIYRKYTPMIDAGATTVWESFSSGTTGGGGFPTRSHCHAWSSAPNYFLPRIVLGYRPLAPASQSAEISPWPCGLTWAKGTIATAAGPVQVEWRLDGDKLDVKCVAPAGMQVSFARNKSLEGKSVTFNGQKQ
jgi:hypothetical protein